METTLAWVPTDASVLVADFLSGRNARTLDAYRRDLEDFRAFTGAETPTEAARLLLSRGHGPANALALQYRAHLVGRKLAPATVNRRLAALRSLVKLASRTGMVPWNLDVDSVKSEAYRDTRGPGREGFIRLLDAVEGRHAKASRDRALLRLLFDVALRRGEVVSLDVEDVDLEAGTVAVMGKGRTEKAFLSIPTKTREAVGNWLEVRPDVIEEDGRRPLFVNFSRSGEKTRLSGTGLFLLVQGLGRRVGIKARPHGLRHAGITEAVKRAQAAGYLIEEVRDFSRHADIRTLMVYRDRERDVQGKLAELISADC